MTPDADMPEHDPCSRLAAYELGLLDAADRRRFETHLAECATCPDALYGNAVEVISLVENPRRMLRALADPEIHQSARSSPGLLQRLRSVGIRPVPRLVWVPVGAATVAVVAISLFVLRPPAPSSIRSLARIAPVPYAVMELRSGGGAADHLFREGMERYARAEYGEAARILRDCRRLEIQHQAPGGTAEISFYLGLALLLSGQPDSAFVPLTEAGESSIRVLRDRSHWYLAQAHLRREDARLAVPFLEGLADSSPAYAAEARRQLAALRKLAGK